MKDNLSHSNPSQGSRLNRNQSSLDIDNLTHYSLQKNVQLQTKQRAVQKQENDTGLPDSLKTGIEGLSGYSMDDVKVHYNSDKPAQINAHAYAQGTDIHLGSGQEKHLPHEAWHVVQQKQGRVKPTTQLKGRVKVNDDAGLEKEADFMGAKALHMCENADLAPQCFVAPQKGTALDVSNEPVQRKVGFEFETSWMLEKPDNVNWNPKSVLASGTNWRMSPDELKGNKAVIEFVTDPMEVDGENAEELGNAIKDGFLNLQQYGDKLTAMNAKGKIPDPKSVFKDVEVTPKDDDLAARPQVTGGVRTDLIVNFLSDTTKEKEDTSGADLMPGEGRKSPMLESGKEAIKGIDKASKGEKEYAGTVTLLSFYIRRAFQRHEHAVAQVREWSKNYFEMMNDPATSSEEKERMRNEYQEKKLDELKKYAPSYAKGIASVLPRVRFSKLPGIKNPKLLEDVLRAAGMKEWEKGRQAWPTGLKVMDDEWQQHNETIEDWITTIQAEDPSEDLTDDHEFWSEQEYEAGEIGYGAEKGGGMLFELRGQTGGLVYTDYYKYAKPYMVYFRELNKKEKPTKA